MEKIYQLHCIAILSESYYHVCLPEDISAIPMKVQAEREVQVPALPQIVSYVTGKKNTFMIQTAYDRLKDIVHVIGDTCEVAELKYLFRNHLDFNDLEFNQGLWLVLSPLLYSIYGTRSF